MKKILPATRFFVIVKRVAREFLLTCDSTVEIKMNSHILSPGYDQQIPWCKVDTTCVRLEKRKIAIGRLDDGTFLIGNIRKNDERG